MRYKIFVCSMIVLELIFPFIPLISTCFRDLHAEKRQDELTRRTGDSDYLFCFDMPLPCYFPENTSFRFDAFPHYGKQEYDALQFIYHDFNYELNESNSQIAVRCKRRNCLHENEPDPRLCDAYIPNALMFQNYYYEPHYITDTVSDRNGNIIHEGNPVLVRETSDGTHRILGEVPYTPGDSVSYTIHRDWVYCFDLSARGEPCSVQRVPLNAPETKSEILFLAPGAESIIPVLFANDLFVFANYPDGVQYLSCTDLNSRKIRYLLENTDPQIHYDFVYADNGFFLLSKYDGKHREDSIVSIRILPSIHTQTLLLNSGSPCSIGYFRNVPFTAYPSSQQEGRSDLYLHGELSVMPYLETLSVSVTEPIICADFETLYIMERDGSKIEKFDVYNARLQSVIWDKSTLTP